MKLSIVIPVYNEESTVHKLIETVLATLSKLPSGLSDFEIIIVEDCSKDRTKDVLIQHYSEHPQISLFFQLFNQGKGAAIARGFQEVKGDIVIIQDADLEYDPQDYQILVRPIVEGKADVVYGSRFKGDVTRVLYFWHYLGNLFLTLISNMLSNINLIDMETCYKVFKAPLIKNMILECKRFGIEPEITAKIAKVKGVRIYEVPISYFGRTYEEGKKIGWKDGVAAIWYILKFNLFYSFEQSFRITYQELKKLIYS